MPDNNQQQAVQSSATPKPKTKKEILEADPDTLTTDELNRKALFIDIEYKDFQRELTMRQTEQMKMKDAQNRDKFFSRGQELKKTEHDQKRHQDGCSHRKGGRSVEALQRGGNSADFAVIRHRLPIGEVWQRCQRCGKTWRPPHKQDYDMTAVSGQQAFEEANRVYKEALSWPTDNIMSEGILFGHTSEDANKTAQNFLHEIMKGTTLR